MNDTIVTPEFFGVKKSFIYNSSCRIFCFFIFFLFIQLSASAQNSQNTIGEKQKLDSSITIHQEINFKVSPHQLYEALLNSEEFSLCVKKSFPMFSATSATIDSAVGGSFKIFDGHIIGRILELVPDKRIVEAWRVVDWPAGVYSIAKFEFRSDGSETTIIFDHIGFPSGLKEHLSIGWKEHYWNALTNYFR